MKKIILIIIMLNLFTVCLSNDMNEDKQIETIVKSLEQRLELMEKEVAITKTKIEEKQYNNQVVVEDMALLSKNDIDLKNNISDFQTELEILEESIKKK